MIGLGLILIAKTLLDTLSKINQAEKSYDENNEVNPKAPRTLLNSKAFTLRDFENDYEFERKLANNRQNKNLRKSSNLSSVSSCLEMKSLDSDENLTEASEMLLQIPQVNKLDQYLDNNHLNIEKENIKNNFLEFNIKEMDEILKIQESIEGIMKGESIPSGKLESILGDEEKGVFARRLWIEEKTGKDGVLTKLPFTQYDYKQVLGACCENVIGYVPVPVGVIGPLLLNGKQYFVPMATTEGCLIASTNRGCKALFMSGGIASQVYTDGMTRGPVLHFLSAMRAVDTMNWLKIEENFEKIKNIFDLSSRFARLQRIQSRVAGRYLYLRFVGSTGDAMGMNMMSKGTEMALKFLTDTFPDIEKTCLSGNFCTDKKAVALNWIEGRGKSVVCEAVIPSKVIRTVLKTSVESLVELNISKNLIGSAVAGTTGGYNAHAANVVAAIFIACGQDPAQVVGSSNCMTLMEARGDSLWVSCTMPSIEVGTIGGGTALNAQSTCLQLLGVKGSSRGIPGTHSQKFASIICATVMAGELSLMSALSSGHLVESHLKLNRSALTLNQI